MKDHRHPSEAKELITHKASELGFVSIGFAKAEYMETEARRLEHWLHNDYHGSMSYMAQHFDKRVDPTLLVPGAQTVISLAYNYYNPDQQKDPEAPQISMYAYGDDYHKILKDKLYLLIHHIRDRIGAVEGRCFVDSAPVLERDWARRSGLGWIGKHTLLLTKKRGSFFFLAELIIDLPIEPDTPVSDHCGSCTRCIDACPTDAISPSGYVLDASRCISYLTIELKDDIPEVFENKMEGWMFGCDICQAVCPWNRFAHRHEEPSFEPNEELMNMSAREWREITEEVFQRIFKKSPVQRTKYEGLKRNINFLYRKFT